MPRGQRRRQRRITEVTQPSQRALRRKAEKRTSEVQDADIHLPTQPKRSRLNDRERKNRQHKVGRRKSGALEWGYHSGILPNQWPEEFPTCAGVRQSPIDIKTHHVIHDTNLEMFDFSELSSKVTMELINTGHLVQVNMGPGLTFSGGGLPGTYIVEQFHFHWGSRDCIGSEHYINGDQFSMEMHVVAHSDKYLNVADAMTRTNGLAVLGFIYVVGSHNSDYDELINNLHNVQHKNDQVKLDSFRLTSLFPEDTESFYRYNGSLTTPLCYESVIWTVFKQHIEISKHQINQFRQLLDLTDNYRDPQDINGRIVTSSFTEDGGPAITRILENGRKMNKQISPR